jgi:DNA repair photolyase
MKMQKDDYFRLVNSELTETIRGMTTGRPITLRKHVYGVLVPDSNHPLSTVSVANSSLSIDLWCGCAWQCTYCHVQGTMADLDEKGMMPNKPQKRTPFSVREILDELVEHPFFIPGWSIISIGTASTEPFAPGEVTESTFEIMNEFISRGLRNPFWIVTKAGVPKGRKLDLAKITSKVKGLMISLCWADNPDTIEPCRNNRFSYAEEAKEAGATICWYMRPIVPEWSGNRDRVEMMMLWVKNRYGKVIDMIVPGGLRWTEGIENGLVEIHKLPMPDIPRNDNVKELPKELRDVIMALGREHFPDVPIYLKSSCALSHMLRLPSITSVQAFSRNECEESHCPLEQRQACAQGGIYDMNETKAQMVLDTIAVPARVISWGLGSGLITEPPLESFTYAVKRTILKALADAGGHYGD